MQEISPILSTVFKILVIVAAFNLIIFVHELGHFLAAKWRGLKVERFQIWFGKPIWKKEIGGVQYGLGWIPAGGFVALPQMAPMEAIEGGNKEERAALPRIKPLDKIIVAFAGPLFSLLLALLAATVVWKIGKPADVIPSRVVGAVDPGSPADKAGLRVGDTILKVNDEEVSAFTGRLDSIFEKTILSEGDTIKFTVSRPGESQPLEIVSAFEVEKTAWYQRSGLRRVGILPEVIRVEIEGVTEGSPAQKAGLQAGDRLVSVNGRDIANHLDFLNGVKAAEGKPFELAYEREGERKTVTLTPVVPVSPAGLPAMVGIMPQNVNYIDESIIHPEPLKQVKDSLNMMWMTVTRLVSPKSGVNLSHLSGPVGIGKVKFKMLEMDHPFHRILAFFVLFNVNLAVLNMLPLPVLDGGHITLAIMEACARKPVGGRFLEWIQTACALMLIGVMLYVTSKDIGDSFGPGGQKVVFPQ